MIKILYTAMIHDGDNDSKPCWAIGNKGNFDTEEEAVEAIHTHLSKYAVETYQMWIQKTYIRVRVEK